MFRLVESPAHMFTTYIRTHKDTFKGTCGKQTCRIFCPHVYTFVQTQGFVLIYVSLYMCPYMCVLIYVSLHMCPYICVRTRLSTHKCVLICVSLYMCPYMCVLIYVSLHMCPYICVRTRLSKHKCFLHQPRGSNPKAMEVTEAVATYKDTYKDTCKDT